MSGTPGLTRSVIQVDWFGENQWNDPRVICVLVDSQSQSRVKRCTNCRLCSFAPVPTMMILAHMLDSAIEKLEILEIGLRIARFYVHALIPFLVSCRLCRVCLGFKSTGVVCETAKPSKIPETSTCRSAACT